MTIYHIDGLDLNPDKINSIWMGGEQKADVGLENACLVYMDGGHIHQLDKSDGLELRRLWRRSNGTTMDVRKGARMEDQRRDGPPPPPRYPLGMRDRG